MRHHIAAAATAACSLLAATATSQNGHIVESAVPKDLASFPADLIQVPGGNVVLGESAKQLEDIATKLQPRDERRRAFVLYKLLSELGEKTVTVQPFFLGKTLVTNEQYLKFVEKTEHRFPYHWWRFGKPEHYRESIAEIKKAFPDSQGDAPLEYWEQKWRDLKRDKNYAIPEGTEKMPVTFVSARDALAYAGWAGMRLCSEAEWLRAARGDQRTEYLWGNDWSDEVLDKLGLRRSPDQKLKPVGTCQFTTGPLGHTDMAGQVWEWTLDPYLTIDGRDAWEKEYKRLPKKILEELANMAPTKFGADSRVIKGGAYFSWSSPEEFRLGTRGRAADFQTVEGVGFRIAKSAIPARDASIARLRVEYDWSSFGGNREPDLDNQVGMERYTLSAGGTVIEDYEAVSFIPVNHMGLDKKVSDIGKFKELTMEGPQIVGTLLTTEKLAKPALEPGLYTVYYRASGMPDELKKALREAYPVLAALAKDPSKKSETPEPWRAVLSKYGITDEEAAQKTAAAELKHIRVKPGNLQVDTESHAFLFRVDKGDYVAALSTSQGPAIGRDPASTLAIDGENPAKLSFACEVRWDDKNKSRTLSYKVPLELAEAPATNRPWRLPNGK